MRGVSNPRGRPVTHEHCDEIAALLARGHTLTHIAEALGLTLNIVATRTKRMRATLAAETGDVDWAVTGRKTPVELAEAWLERKKRARRRR